MDSKKPEDEESYTIYTDTDDDDYKSSRSYSRFKELQRCYENIIGQESLKNYDWYVTVQTTELDLCLKSISEKIKPIDKPIGKPIGIYFSPNLVNSKKRPTTSNWIDWVFEEGFRREDFDPDSSIVTAVGINKNNIFTYKSGKLVINDPCSELSPTDQAKKIYLINSAESIKYITEKYMFKEPGYYRSDPTKQMYAMLSNMSPVIDWDEFYLDGWKGVILNITELSKTIGNLDRATRQKCKWYTNWDVDQLIVTNNMCYDKCFKVSDTFNSKRFFACDKPLPIDIDTSFDISLTEDDKSTHDELSHEHIESKEDSHAEKPLDNEFKRKYLKYKNKYISLKKVLNVRN